MKKIDKSTYYRSTCTCNEKNVKLVGSIDRFHATTRDSPPITTRFKIRAHLATIRVQRTAETKRTIINFLEQETPNRITRRWTINRARGRVIRYVRFAGREEALETDEGRNQGGGTKWKRTMYIQEEEEEERVVDERNTAYVGVRTKRSRGGEGGREGALLARSIHTTGNPSASHAVPRPFRSPLTPYPLPPPPFHSEPPLPLRRFRCSRDRTRLIARPPRVFSRRKEITDWPTREFL